MSDAMMAANAIRGDMAFYRMIDGLTAAHARRNYENELSYLQARTDWLTRSLKRVCDEYGKLVDTANGREAEYRRRIADLEQENASLKGAVARGEAENKELDKRMFDGFSYRDSIFQWLYDEHNRMLANYKSLLLSVPEDMLAGDPGLLADYKTVQESGAKPEGG